MPERIISLTKEVSTLTTKQITEIQSISRLTKILAMNALVESAHAGEFGKGFAIVAQEVSDISDRMNSMSKEFSSNLGEKLKQIDTLGGKLVKQIRGSRLVDLSHNMIEIMDRNLYERSCDVRWWATDSAVVNLASDPSPDKATFASDRLAVILGAYTVYLDIWIMDRQGNVLASGRPQAYPEVKKQKLNNAPWFQEALNSSSGNDFSVADVERQPALNQKAVATYAASIRENGDANGKVIGVLGIFFDWETQSQTIVDGVHLTRDEKTHSTALLVDSKFRVIASSKKEGLLSDKIVLKIELGPQGNYIDEKGNIVGFSQTPGYETYKGLGWYGVIVQEPNF
jgi:hypothetical protein